MQELSSLSEKPVVLVCRTYRRSSSAAALLGDAGFRNVLVLCAGMMIWNEACSRTFVSAADILRRRLSSIAELGQYFREEVLAGTCLKSHLHSSCHSHVEQNL